ncbi:hypothetical protein ABFS82_05G100600 [Erythranthe guttata]
MEFVSEHFRRFLKHPYVKVYLGEARVARTARVRAHDTQNPVLPDIRLDDGRNFEHQKCWEDICRAILEAQNLVYIAGWSIYHKVMLVRESSEQLPNGGDLSLGELLKYKSQQGVRVVLLLWDDKTSQNKCFFKSGGLMQTHDKETRKFFKHSYVTCVLKGPRQPWHDLHCKIEGPAAYDMLKNFEQRWKKATECSDLTRFCKKILGQHDYNLVNIEHISQIASPSGTIPNDHQSLWVSKEGDPENWHIQIFRSVDLESVDGFPKNVLAAKEQNLVLVNKWAIDRSIQMAYIQAIRSAQRFIFIENQYFIGHLSLGHLIIKQPNIFRLINNFWSSFYCPNNLIPMELALKIASKIRANERFVVYVIIPMWPEGEPSSPTVQGILYWQSQTMQMMYKIIAHELKSVNLKNAHPTDYLNFYCLGNREENHKEESSSDSASEAFRRFMIYVHSKGMIVDDEYVIIGSANINQRSMAGYRDTEIAMGAYQPHYTWAKKKEHPLEHLGCIENCFKNPENLECVKYTNSIADNNWKRYIAEEYSSLQGHILKYPVKVEVDGKVNHLPGQKLFPDVGGLVLGNPTCLPDLITT